MHSCDQLLLDLGQTAGLSQPLRFDDHGCARLMVGAHLALDFERDAEAGGAAADDEKIMLAGIGKSREELRAVGDEGRHCGGHTP